MADQPQSGAELQKPAGAGTPPEEVVIHVIPDKFHGAALKQQAPKVQPPAASPPPPKPPLPTAPPMPRPPAPPQPPPVPGRLAMPQPKKRSKLPLIFGIVAGVLVIGAVAAYFLLSPKKPAPAQVPPPPPAPVCGDIKCETPQETPLTCPSDCGPPPAVCGNGSIESGEQCDDGNTAAGDGCNATCRQEAVCGNGSLEELEECDDNNTADGDGCSAVCKKEAVCGDNQCQETETLQSCPEDCRPPEPTFGKDSDSDGLTDLEETGIYGTDSFEVNTDRDSYVDLNEVLNMFDPARPEPALLRDNPGVSLNQVANQNYEILRPTGWSPRENDEQGREVLFSAPSGEIIAVLTQEIPAGSTLTDWYLTQSPGVEVSSLEVAKTRQSYELLFSPDRLTAYVKSPAAEQVWVLTYTLGTQTEMQYRATFRMMINSLRSTAR